MPSKLVTNYDSMFSDLPNYPRQHEVRWEVTGNRNFGEVDFFAATGSDVGGRDRSKFFKRPILPNATPIPFIRYAKEMSQSEDDLEKRRSKFRENSEKSFDEKKANNYFGGKKFGTKISFGTQTDFREIDVQTDPCTISYETDEIIRRRPEVTTLAILKHGRGLPVKTTDDLDLVDELRRQRALEERLPTPGDPRRPLLQRAIFQKRQTIEAALDQKTSFARMSQRTRQLQYDVRQFGEASSRQLDERLERLWRHKQQEKEDRMKVIRKIHEKEQKSLEKKCNDLNSYIHRGTFKRPPSYQERLSRSAGDETDFSKSIPPFTDPFSSRPTTSSRLRRVGLDDDFLTTYNGLRALEKETSSKITSCVNVGRGKNVKKEIDKKSIEFPPGYVKRGERYRNTLDTAFDEIVAKKRQEKDGTLSEVEKKKKQELYEFFRKDYLERSPTPTVYDDEHRQSTKLGNIDIEKDIEKAKEVRREVEKIRADRQKFEVKMSDSFADDNVDHEAYVDAFMDEIEGETLGQMLNYLSSELESSTDDRSTDEMLSKQNVDKIFDEITKVTQSTVDRYLDTILLDTLYRHAGQSALKETERSDPDGERRCSSASGTDESKIRMKRLSGGLGIKQRIKDFQRQHLLAAGEALYAVLADLKSKGEIGRDNRDDVEQNIREALEDFCRPENLERELRKAMDTLNIDSKSKEE